MQEQNEALPQTAYDISLPDCKAPVLDDNIKITYAKINNENVLIPENDNELVVNVNIPFEELEGVYASVPISIGNTKYELKRDMVLEYKNNAWRKTFSSGSRINLIIDDCKIVVWAVTKDKKESAAFKLPINWLLN